MKKVDLKYRISILFALFISITILLYFMIQKSSYHIDEIYSYGLSNHHFSPFLRFGNEWIDVESYRNYVTVQESQKFRFDSVIYNQINDVHPPLFYLILHTVSSFFTGTFSKWFGLSINLVTQLCIFFSLLSVLKKITPNKWSRLIILISYMISLPSISNMLYIRMYGMLTLFSILLINHALKLLESKSINFKLAIEFIIIIVLGALTHYYFFLYLFFVVLITGILLFAQKEWLNTIIYWILSIVGLIVSYLIFPSMLTHLLSSDRGVEATSGIVVSFSDIRAYLYLVAEQYFAGSMLIFIFFIIVSVVILVYLGKRGSNKNKTSNQCDTELFYKYITLFSSTLLTLILISIVSPYQDERYIFHIFPMILVCIFSLVEYGIALITTKEVSLIVVSILSICFLVFGYSIYTPNYIYPEQKYALEEINNITYLDVVMFFKPGSAWRQHAYLNEIIQFEGKVYPKTIETEGISEFSIIDDYLSKNEEIFVIIDDDFNHHQLIELLKNEFGFEDSTFIFSHGYGNAYHLKK